MHNTIADLVAEGLVMLGAAEIDAENAEIQVAVMRTRDIGRPKILINTNQLADMLQLHFKVPQIAKLFGVSVCTIRHRMQAPNCMFQIFILHCQMHSLMKLQEMYVTNFQTLDTV